MMENNNQEKNKNREEDQRTKGKVEGKSDFDDTCYIFPDICPFWCSADTAPPVHAPDSPSALSAFLNICSLGRQQWQW
ncbi:hypothetical protein K0M31_007177 [Melipona bicolor]|uniref:Uncharacterized protein n=1 Tax=Melipona bicolor TaxID=60889 RepID=A0AA40KL54_9HYME|nr:hypothetical protein K0M31_007177 [Melipona bicolor]